MKHGDRVSGMIYGLGYTGTVRRTIRRQGEILALNVHTDKPLVTPSGREVRTVLVRGAAEVAALVRVPNCTTWPHNPPSCGCPA